MKTWFLAVPLFLSTAAANASLITIDPDNFAPGTNISEQVDGVSLAVLVFGGGSMLRQDAYSTACGPSALCSELGTAVFGYQTSSGSRSSFSSDGGSATYCLQAQPAAWCATHPQTFLEITFDVAASFVQVESAHYSDWPMFWAFDASGNLLQLNEQRTFTAPWPYNTFETTTLTSASSNISRLVVSGGAGYVTLDRITSQSVPEPGTLGMLMLGVSGMLVSMRKRTLK